MPIAQFFQGVGRRKTSVAQVRITPNGKGTVLVNEVAITGDPTYLSPLKLTGLLGAVDVSIHVRGGGFAGQEGAIRHGIARALVELDEAYRGSLRAAGYLTRDSRMKERKKYGLKGARRAPQWSKR